MKKRFLPLALVLALCLALLPATALATDRDFIIRDGALIAYIGPGGNAVIPDGVTSIEYGAFQDCDSLVSVTIPNSVSSIGMSAFAGCSGLASVTLGTGVNEIGTYAFRGCTSLASVAIPDSVTKISFSVFENCTSLAKVTIGSGLADLGWHAFSGCTSLTGFDVAEDNPTYGSKSGVLFNNTESELVAYPSGKLDPYYTIPNTARYIESYAFEGCSNLIHVTIPSTTGYIGVGVFAHCPNLIGISVAPDNRSYCADGGVCFDGVKKTLIAYPGGKVGAYTIPDSVTTIDGSAFKGCAGLTGVIIPASVTKIEFEAFKDCINLSHITNLSGVNCSFAGCTSLTGVIMPNGSTKINDEMFAGCKSLAGIIIPGGVTSIGMEAFQDCENLTDIIIPDSVAEMSVCVFEGCTSLTHIAIPSGITAIPYGVFNRCTSLTDVYYNGSEADWRAVKIYDDNDALTNATIHYNSIGPALAAEGVFGTLNAEEYAWNINEIGRLTMTAADNNDPAADNIILAATWDKNGKFLGVKMVSGNTAKLPESWRKVKLIWVNAQQSPHCPAAQGTKK